MKENPDFNVNNNTVKKRKTTSAPDLIQFLWVEANGNDKQLVLDVFDENIVYEDFTFEKPFVGIICHDVVG